MAKIFKRLGISGRLRKERRNVDKKINYLITKLSQ